MLPMWRRRAQEDPGRNTRLRKMLLLYRVKISRADRNGRHHAMCRGCALECFSFSDTFCEKLAIPFAHRLKLRMKYKKIKYNRSSFVPQNYILCCFKRIALGTTLDSIMNDCLRSTHKRLTLDACEQKWEYSGWRKDREAPSDHFGNWQ